jgi:hypothetical protein
MSLLPHDVPDLFLAPVVLQLEARIEELGQLDLEGLTTEVAVVSNTSGWTRELRASGLVDAVKYLVDCHDWELSWDPRGIRVAHGAHQLVLGVPPTFHRYVMGAPHRGVRELLL